MSKHTPGPWEGHIKRADDNILYSVVTSGDTAVCELAEEDQGKQKMRDNTHLISAAPELLEACEWMLEVLDAIHEDYWGVIDDSVFAGIEDSSNVAREAIAKAKGGE